MDLVLRKRISVRIYKKQSWKDSLLRKIAKVNFFSFCMYNEKISKPHCLTGTSLQAICHWTLACSWACTS